MRKRAYISHIGLEGILQAISPLPLLLPFFGGNTAFPELWRLIIAVIAAMTCFFCSLTLLRHPFPGKLLGGFSVSAGYVAMLPAIRENPFLALTSTVTFFFIMFMLIDFNTDTRSTRSTHKIRCLERARWSALTVPYIVLLVQLTSLSELMVAHVTITLSACTTLALFFHWSYSSKSWRYCLLPLFGLTAIIGPWFYSYSRTTPQTALVLSLACLLLLPRHAPPSTRKGQRLEILITHPARFLFTTFIVLCIAGTFLLTIPASSRAGSIQLLDAVFTSVSAVCVTGLIVLDTPSDFTFLGQLFILILIQLGGLGIMGITTVALHSLGRRLSLKHERLVSSLMDTSHLDLVRALTLILKFTFITEGLGALILSVLFFRTGDNFPQALWKGTFTAISAFCNAGFALQSDSLIPYQSNPLILHVIAALIVVGGLAPATNLMFFRWMEGKHVPVAIKIALNTTVLLLITGTFFFLVFEWNGALKGLSTADKALNAWFQSVTLRTAGFNSVSLEHLTNPTIMIMIFLMFIGGSPGGTAGGVKTTTIGILAMTFWTNIANRNEVVIQNRRISSSTIFRAVTIVISGFVVWFLAVLMLSVTQPIAFRDLCFEATSALATVGLSTGATGLLDEIGKVIIILTMFIGRIGPITIFMLLSNEPSAPTTRHLVETVSIT